MIFQADATQLPLPDRSVDLVLGSPPYCDARTYGIGDRVLPSVTQVLKEAGLIDDTFYTPESALRGTRVHEAIAIVNRGQIIDDDTIDPVIQPYLAAFWRFRRDMATRMIVTHVEERVYSASYGYAGTLDFRGTLDRFPFTVDVKAGAKARWHSLQTAAYGAAVGTPHKRFCLYLDKDETYSFEQHKDASDRAAFLGALALVNWKRSKAA